VVVAWDLDTTGRRLIDEICQVAGFYIFDKEECDFSQYVMPHKNPNPGARRSFGIKVASMGRYRMLKDVETGKILKTKSEVSALQDFISWLKEAKEKSKTDGVVLVCHEPARKVLVPLFLEALRRYNLLEAFDEVVVAFANSVKVAEKYADSEKVTSYR
jgi:maternal-effect protein exuperantia